MKIKFDVYMNQQLGTLYKNNELDLKGQIVHVLNLDMVQVDRIEVNYSVGSNKYTSIAIISDPEIGEVIIPFNPDVLQVGANALELVAYMIDGAVKVSQTCIYNVKEGIGSNNFIDWPDGSDNPGYATIAYVNEAIKEIELTPGPQGPQGEPGPMGPQGPKGEDYDPAVLDDYATIKYVDKAINNIETDLDIMVIGDGSEEYIFTGNEFTDEEYENGEEKTVLLNNVRIADTLYNNELVHIRLDVNAKKGYLLLYVNRPTGIYEEYNFEADGNISYYSGNFLTDRDLWNYATIEYVDMAISDANINGGGGLDVMTIGDGINEYIFTGYEFTDEEYSNRIKKSVYLRGQVTIYSVDIRGREKKVAFTDELVYIDIMYEKGSENKLVNIQKQDGIYYEFSIAPDGVITQMLVDKSVKQSQTENFASISYVDDAVANVKVDLTGYATEKYVDNKFDPINKDLIDLTDAIQYVDGEVDKLKTSIGDIGLLLDLINGEEL